nr:bifunctional adenosylcobinamide kinase/adenosylcobinamide-phosphate guanylyltransferase [uncultured Caproiciproducens sp.]
MRLIIGGYGQGKLNYLLRETGLQKNQVVDGEQCELNQTSHCFALNHLHLYLRRLMEQGHDPQSIIEQMITENSDMIIVCDEVGCGIVPMEPFEREWRETTGRICCMLAQRATRVDRVFCGIATTIKEKNNEELE